MSDGRPSSARPDSASPAGSYDYDWVVIGSGFGGSVAALRLAEKGYSVLVVEKGRRLGAADFPKTNWNLKRWLWLPALRFFGLFKITLFRHVTVLSGVGVGGGSLVYANTLPLPQASFFTAPSWASLADWRRELAPHYDTALRMLGGTVNPRLSMGDEALRRLALEIGRPRSFSPATVAVYFAEGSAEVGAAAGGATAGGAAGARGDAAPGGATAGDPYFDGAGPARSPCTYCGGCMTGCRFGAKNTLDKNYLHLAERLGVVVQAESEVFDVRPLPASQPLRRNPPRRSGGDHPSPAGGDLDGSRGYRVAWRPSAGASPRRGGAVTCRGVVFAAGVLGTVKLLLSLSAGSLPRLSARVGHGVRTNAESLIGVTVPKRTARFSEGVAIGSMLQVDERTNLQPVRYSEGSGAWRLLMSPLASGRGLPQRLLGVARQLLRHPFAYLKLYLVDDWAKRTQILLFMQTSEGTLRFTLGRFGALRSALDSAGPATANGAGGAAGGQRAAAGGRRPRPDLPTAFIPEAHDLARRYARIVGGMPMVLLTETLLGTPTTAHILGGATMGRDASEGVIDPDHRLFGYANLYVCDGSAVSANPGVNPSLTIAALAERAMSRIDPKAGLAR